MPVRRKLVRERAQRLLADNGIHSAPVPVVQIAEALGIEIKYDDVDDKLSGFLYREKDSGRTVIGVNDNDSIRRQRFTIAHEIGHFLLHEGEVVHVDEDDIIFTMDFRDGRSSTGNDDNEREANLFAAELLMPEAFLRSDLRGKYIDLLDDGHNDELGEVANRYEVSIQALTLRLTNLGHLEF